MFLILTGWYDISRAIRLTRRDRKGQRGRQQILWGWELLNLWLWANCVMEASIDKCNKRMHRDKSAKSLGRRVVTTLSLLTLCITIHKSGYSPSSSINSPLGLSDKMGNVQTIFYTAKLLSCLFICLLYFLSSCRLLEVYEVVRNSVVDTVCKNCIDKVSLKAKNTKRTTSRKLLPCGVSELYSTCKFACIL